MIAVRRTRRRLAFTVIIVAAIVVAFLVRLVDIQVVRAGELTAASEQRRSVPTLTYGARGDIVDRNGAVLADTVYRYDITVAPKFVADSTVVDDETGERSTRTVADALGAIAALTGQEAPELQSSIDAELAADPDDDHAYLVRGVTTEVYRAVRDLGIPWVYFERQPARTYPNGQVAGNLVGFLGTDAPQTGLEASMDDCLAATNGTSTYERGADGVRLPGSTVVEQAATDGGTLRTTIDTDLQWFAQQAIEAQGSALGADWATAMVVRVVDGQILAAADWPTVDPNDVNGTAPDNLGSRIFSSPYEPGSIMKPVTFSALLDAGVTTPSEKVTVRDGYATISDFVIRDAWPHGDLALTSAGILVNSSNIGTAQLTERLSIAQREQYLRGFGLGDYSGVDFLGESAGFVDTAENVDGHRAFVQMFGQGVTATSAQMAGAYQVIANDGVRVPLTLVAGCERADGTVTDVPSAERVRVVSESAADGVVAMLEGVVTDGALSSQLSIPGYRVAAKTGTAEVAENGVYTNERIVSVAGMAPAEDPQYLVIVTYGKPDTMKVSAAAAPTFQSIMTQVLKTYRVPPSTQPAPRLPLTW
ncbi:peptidoglycan D,D-transpeptidase FtsI family protein [Microcella flavibacter]|uniref:peptidoglycan D,D-transpeptidase FtsI family protein n=1 Tax=Microcella flavibacter TaxID=1804990 RepID=UPI001E30779E|nr:penicillin-binding protein 2 [Microcella flavibacter]